MEVKSIAVDVQEDGSSFVTVVAQLPVGIALDSSDVAVLDSIIKEVGAQAGSPAVTETTSRRSRGTVATEAPAAEAAPATRRRGRGKAAEAAEAPAAEAAPATRRRQREAAPVDPGISDADLSKALSTAAEKIGPQLVADILKEDYKTDDAATLSQEDRVKFMAELKFQAEG